MTTEDGYILSMQNIPGGRSVGGSEGGRKQPVLLQHGILMVCMYMFTYLSMNVCTYIDWLVTGNAHDILKTVWFDSKRILAMGCYKY